MKYLAIDIGGTFIKYALMNKKADILEKSKIKTPIEDGNTFDDLIDTLFNIYTKYKNEVAGIAISMPGILDSDTGYSYTGGYLNYVSKQNIVSLLKERCNIPVTVENDGKCAALAELWCGKLKDVKNGAVVILGTGVAGGIVIDGKLHKGSNFSAGEFSYIAENEENCSEFSGYWGSISGVGNLLELVSKETNIPVIELDGIKVFEMATNNDEKVLKALNLYAKKLAIKIYNLQVLLDLDIISLGGGISQQPLLLDYVRKNINEFCSNHPLKNLSPFIPTPVVTTCTYFNDSNLIGALYHYLNKREMVTNE